MPTHTAPAAVEPGSSSRALFIAGIVAAGGFALLYMDVIRRLVLAWDRDPNYSHGFLIAPLSMFLVWQRRALLSSSGSWWGLLGMIGAYGLLLTGELGAELFLTRFSLVVMAASITLFLVGWQGLRVLALPLGLLLLTIPIPAIIFNQVAFPLQLIASQAGEGVLQILEIPVLREGNVIVLSNMTLEVAEACSGIRSLMSLISLAIVYGLFTHTALISRIALIAFSVPIAILANAARVAGTGVAAHYYGPAVAEGFMHTFSGWLVFLVALLLLIGSDRVLLRWHQRRPAPAPQPGEVVA